MENFQSNLTYAMSLVLIVIFYHLKIIFSIKVQIRDWGLSILPKR